MQGKQPLPCDADADQAPTPDQTAFRAEAQAEIQAEDGANSADCADAAPAHGQAAASVPEQTARQGVGGWLAVRLPSLVKLYQRSTRHYFVPKNLNIWYVFGFLALLALGIQVLSGLALAVHYKGNVAQAFASLEHIMRHVPNGAVIRYAHSTGASVIFILLYLHIARGLLYGSYRKPRELVWLVGCALFVLVMAEAFVGHLLPWGQMSYWGAQVISNLLMAIPGIGPDVAVLLRGGPVVGEATLSRFFVLHVVVIPLFLLGFAVLHILALRDVGSSNPDGVDLEQGPRGNRWSPTAPADTVPFHPYYTVRDAWAAGVFLTVFFAIVFFAPEMGGFFLEPANFEPANPLQTPQHIAPLWYFRPFYAILRSITSGMTAVLAVASVLLGFYLLFARRSCGSRRLAGRKRWWACGGLLALALLLGLVPSVLEWSRAPAWALQGWEQMAGSLRQIPVLGRAWWLLCMGIDAGFWGLAAMAASILVLCALPWLDRSPVASIRYRPRWHRVVYGLFAAVFVFLGLVGGWEATVFNILLGQAATVGYFAFFLLMPWWSRQGQFSPVPQRLTYRGQQAKTQNAHAAAHAEAHTEEHTETHTGDVIQQQGDPSS